MAAFYDLVNAPQSSNPLIAGLFGDRVYRPGFVVTYGLAGKAGSQGFANDGGTLWAANGAREAFQGAVAAWNEVSGLVIKPSPFYFAEGGDRKGVTWLERLTFDGDDPDYLGAHDVPETPDQEGEFNAQSVVWSRESNAKGGYNFVTFLHEIGHGLGLDHPHEGAVFPGVKDAGDFGAFGLNQGLFTVMTYNDGYESVGYSPSLGYGWMATPGALDIAAMQLAYGPNNATRTGDDTYRLPDQNAPGTFFACIWDAGGLDAISAEGLTRGVVIDLRPATLRVEEGGGGFLSRADGVFGGFTIAAGVTIERALGGLAGDKLIGSDRADVLIGGGGADTLTGGAGGDLFAGARAELNGDRITDLGLGDRIQVSDAGVGLSWTRAGERLTLSTGEVLTLAGAPNVRLASVPGGTGATLSALRHDAGLNDFNGDGSADILWARAGGGVATWNVTAGGVQGAFFAGADASWRAVDAFDWSGDGRSDILWRNADGSVAVWAAVDGGFQGSFHRGPVGGSWQVAGTGDLNGDGRDDVVWRDASGALSAWSSTGSGFVENSFFHAPVGASWRVAGVGDLNGDGRDDVVWRNDDGSVSTWLASGQGSSVSFDGNAFFARVGPEWRIAGVADLNGDGLDDLVWRSDGGAVSAWRSTGSGFRQNAFFDGSVGADWRLAQVADANADGMADLLWHNTSGAISAWLSTGDDFVRNALYSAGPSDDWLMV